MNVKQYTYPEVSRWVFQPNGEFRSVTRRSQSADLCSSGLYESTGPRTVLSRVSSPGTCARAPRLT